MPRSQIWEHACSLPPPRLPPHNLSNIWKKKTADPFSTLFAVQVSLPFHQHLIPIKNASQNKVSLELFHFWPADDGDDPEAVVDLCRQDLNQTSNSIQQTKAGPPAHNKHHTKVHCNNSFLHLLHCVHFFKWQI